MDLNFDPHKSPVVPERTRIHAAPPELGEPYGAFGYKHGAPKGAFLIAPKIPVKGGSR
jgi:hypothetical protein